MKNWIYIVYIGLMGCLVSSCQQSLDEEIQVPTTIEKAKVSFSIALNDVVSRATWWENDGIGMVGSGNDNAINNLQVWVHHTDVNNQSASALVTITDFYQVNGSENIYKVEGEFTIDDLSSETLSWRLEVFANSTKNVETFIQGTSIPMWGEKKMTTLNFSKGEVTELAEPIYLLRAMSKVEVLVAEGVGTLENVTVSNYNPTGYVLPKFPETLQDYDGTEDLDQETVFNPYLVSETLGTNLEFLSDDSNGGFYAYLPECQNVDAAGNKLAAAAHMTVTIDGKEYPLEFKIYENDTPFNLVRNHYYQYTIVGIPDPEVQDDVKLVYKVIDYYNDYKIGIEFN